MHLGFIIEVEQSDLRENEAATTRVSFEMLKMMIVMPDGGKPKLQTLCWLSAAVAVAPLWGCADGGRAASSQKNVPWQANGHFSGDYRVTSKSPYSQGPNT